MGRLDGKVAIVTGAGSGIGEATARLMVAEGASVVVADINDSAAGRVAGELDRAVAAAVDVSDESSVVRMIDTAVESFGGLDVLHNNATDSLTVNLDVDVVTIDMAVFDRLVAVNLRGVVMGCKHAIPHMLERGGGSIVSTVSIEASWLVACAPSTARRRQRSSNSPRVSRFSTADVVSGATRSLPGSC